MKVLFINTVCSGSTGQIIDYLIDTEFSNDQCVVAYGRGSPFNNHKTHKIGTLISVLCHAFISRLFDASGFGSYFATKRFIAWIKKFKPDLIWLHNIHGYYLNIKLLFSFLKKTDIKIYWTLHDCWPFTGHCAYFSAIGCNEWKCNGCRKCRQKHKYPKAFISRSNRNFKFKKEVFSNVKNMTLFCPSEWLKRHVECSFLNQYKTLVYENPLKQTIFKPVSSNLKEKLGINDKTMILGVANIWEERKGLHFFVELRKALNSKYAIVLVGLNNKQIIKYRKDFVCFSRVRIDELVKFYSAADLYLNPSVEETFGMTTLEAIKCGTKVLVFENTACEEVVRKYATNGFVVSPNISSIEKTIKDIFHDE